VKKKEEAHPVLCVSRIKVKGSVPVLAIKTEGQ
jgi:hypothetical protein